MAPDRLQHDPFMIKSGFLAEIIEQQMKTDVSSSLEELDLMVRPGVSVNSRMDSSTDMRLTLSTCCLCLPCKHCPHLGSSPSGACRSCGWVSFENSLCLSVE